MNYRTKLALSILIGSITILGVFSYGFHLGQTYAFEQRDTGSSTGYVEVIVTRKDGRIEYYGHHNTLMTIGRKYLRNLLAAYNITNGNATLSIALSNDGAPSASWTKLPNEFTSGGLDRNEGTVTILNASAYKVEYEFTLTADQSGISCTGLHWSSVDGSDGNLFAAGTISTVNGLSGDKIKIIWTINFAA